LKYLANRIPNVRDSKPLSHTVTLSDILNLLKDSYPPNYKAQFLFIIRIIRIIRILYIMRIVHILTIVYIVRIIPIERIIRKNIAFKRFLFKKL
jgi:hypothetical protein